MKPLIASITCLLFLALSAAPLSAGSSKPRFFDYPITIHDCCVTGTFKFSQVYDYDSKMRGDEPIKIEECLEGYGLTKKFKLKSFVVSDMEGCSVKVYYGECMMEDRDRNNKMVRQKFYWFDSYNSHTTAVCDLMPDCHIQLDSVCDGIKPAKNGKMVSSGRGPGSDDDDGPAYGKKFARSIFFCQNSDDDLWVKDDCEPLNSRAVGCCDENGDYLTVVGSDLVGPLTKCKISTKMSPTAKPYKYLRFYYETPEKPETRSAYICAPKKLNGPFYSYYLNRSGYTCEYPSPELIRVNPDLTIEQGYSAYNTVPGYDFASINACVSYRLNTNLTAMVNLLDPIFDDGNRSDEMSYNWLEMPKSEPDPGRGNSECMLEPQSLSYGVVLVGLYLESKGYYFDHYGLECAVAQALCLPNVIE